MVIGGTGFIGSHLCDAIIGMGVDKLTIFDNLCASSIKNVEHLLNNDKVELIIADVRDYDRVECQVLQHDVIFNLAAGNVGNSTISPRVDLETNIIGTFNVMQAVKKNSEIRVVHASSGSVVNPTTPYAISKLAGENYCLFYAKEYGVKVSIVRYHHVFGPRQDMNGKCGVINIFLSRILKGLPPVIWGKGEAIKCFTYIKDVVDATLLLIEDDKTIGKVYDVSSDTRITIKELAELLIELYADKEMEPIYDNPKIGENMELHPDTSPLIELGWNTKHGFKDGLDITEKWVKKNL